MKWTAAVAFYTGTLLTLIKRGLFELSILKLPIDNPNSAFFQFDFIVKCQPGNCWLGFQG